MGADLVAKAFACYNCCPLINRTKTLAVALSSTRCHTNACFWYSTCCLYENFYFLASHGHGGMSRTSKVFIRYPALYIHRDLLSLQATLPQLADYSYMQHPHALLCLCSHIMIDNSKIPLEISSGNQSSTGKRSSVLAIIVDQCIQV